MPEIDPRDHDTSRQRTQEIEGDMGGHRATVHCAWPCLLVGHHALGVSQHHDYLTGDVTAGSLVRDRHRQLLSGDLAHAEATFTSFLYIYLFTLTSRENQE